VGRPRALRRLPHTKWAWRRTAKWVICEVGLSVNGEQSPGNGLTDLICAMGMATPDVGRQRCLIGFLSGLGGRESITATKVSA
jgi:hypothetical protein